MSFYNWEKITKNKSLEKQERWCKWSTNFKTDQKLHNYFSFHLIPIISGIKQLGLTKFLNQIN